MCTHPLAARGRVEKEQTARALPAARKKNIANSRPITTPSRRDKERTPTAEEHTQLHRDALRRRRNSMQLNDLVHRSRGVSQACSLTSDTRGNQFATPGNGVYESPDWHLCTLPKTLNSDGQLVAT